MHITKSQNYFHHSLLDSDGILRAKSILVVGGTGSGKSMTGETIKEELSEHDPHLITIAFYDATDKMESAFWMFPATEKNHLNRLEYFKRKAKASDKVKLHYIMGSRMKNYCKKMPKNSDIITFSAKRALKMDEVRFLLGKKEDTKAHILMLKAAEMLKEDEDLKFINKHARKLVERPKVSYMGQTIQLDDEDIIADRSDLKDMNSALQLLLTQPLIMPDNFKHNFNAKEMLKESGVTHVFIYKGLPKDEEKLRLFCCFHIFNEFTRYVSECKNRLLFYMEEMQSFAPDENDGYNGILAKVVGNQIGLLRKSARGIFIVMLGRVWSKIAMKVRSEARKQLIFKLEQDDMLKYTKVRSLGKKEKENIENLQAGEYIQRGIEKRIIYARPPAFGHCIEQMQFDEEYKKHFPDSYLDLSYVLKDVEDCKKSLEKKYLQMKNEELEKEKSRIRREQAQKNKVQDKNQIINQYEQQDKERREAERQKRDDEIIKVFNELKNSGEMKPSYRNIAKIVNDKGFKVSFVTVKNVLDSYQPPTGEEPAPVKNS